MSANHSESLEDFTLNPRKSTKEHLLGHHKAFLAGVGIVNIEPELTIGTSSYHPGLGEHFHKSTSKEIIRESVLHASKNSGHIVYVAYNNEVNPHGRRSTPLNSGPDIPILVEHTKDEN